MGLWMMDNAINGVWNLRNLVSDLVLFNFLESESDVERITATKSHISILCRQMESKLYA
jgi:hypothetical protein